MGGALLYNGVCGGMNACVRVSVVCECKRERGWVSFGESGRGGEISYRDREIQGRESVERKKWRGER